MFDQSVHVRASWDRSTVSSIYPSKGTPPPAGITGTRLALIWWWFFTAAPHVSVG